MGSVAQGSPLRVCEGGRGRSGRVRGRGGSRWRPAAPHTLHVRRCRRAPPPYCPVTAVRVLSTAVSGQVGSGDATSSARLRRAARIGDDDRGSRTPAGTTLTYLCTFMCWFQDGLGPEKSRRRGRYAKKGVAESMSEPIKRLVLPCTHPDRCVNSSELCSQCDDG